MRIKWNNIVIAALGLGALIFFLRHRDETSGVLSTVKRIGPGNSPEDMTLGLLTIGICGVVLVAIVRLLCHNPPTEPRSPRHGPSKEPED